MNPNTIINQVPYLNTTREFPIEASQLVVEVDRAYVDTANAVNLRTIGIFPTNRGAITGESWFISKNLKQQTIRQVYTFTTTAAIAHGIKNLTVIQPTRCFGSYTDGTNSYGLVWGTSTATPGLITFYVTSSQIIFVLGAGSPALSSGRIILEWLSVS